MRGSIRLLALSAVPLVLSTVTPAAPADDRSVVIVYKDGHRQSLTSAEIAHIDLKGPGAIVYKDGHREKLHADVERIEFGESGIAMTPGRSHYVGKWEVGDGSGNQFFITLDSDGSARKTRGAPHGSWALVDGEAHISWDDGWHDAIRKTGTNHEKFAYEPGKSFDDKPSNVTEARKTRVEPI